MKKCIMSGCGKLLNKTNRNYTEVEMRENPFNAICKDCAHKIPVTYKNSEAREITKQTQDINARNASKLNNFFGKVNL